MWRTAVGLGIYTFVTVWTGGFYESPMCRNMMKFAIVK
jgi:hypothetical protein